MSKPITFASSHANPEVPGIMDIDPQEVWKRREHLEIVDVRRPDEFTGELGHIPGARLIVLDSLPDRVTELPQDRAIVFVCRSGGRSARATAFAVQNGLRHAYNLKGGMLNWNELGLAVEERSED